MAEYSDRQLVRLLLNDVDKDDQVFADVDIDAFLQLEGGHVKLAAAQAIDTNASNEVLASKVLRTQDLTTDGAKLADALRAHAQRLRDQHDADDAGYADIIEAENASWPELVEHPTPGWL